MNATKTDYLRSLTVGSQVAVVVRFGMVRSRTETGVVTRVTPARLYVRSGGNDRVFLLNTGCGYGDNKHCYIAVP